MTVETVVLDTIALRGDASAIQAGLMAADSRQRVQNQTMGRAPDVIAAHDTMHLVLQAMIAAALEKYGTGNTTFILDVQGATNARGTDNLTLTFNRYPTSGVPEVEAESAPDIEPADEEIPSPLAVRRAGIKRARV